MAVNVLANLRSHMEYNMLVQKIKDCADAQELDQKKKFFSDAKAAVKQTNTGAPSLRRKFRAILITKQGLSVVHRKPIYRLRRKKP